MKNVIFSISIALLLAACSSTTSSKFTSLNGNEFILKADRVSENPNVQFPHSGLEEGHYTKINEGLEYSVVISLDGDTVTIMPGQIRGQKINDRKRAVYFELEEGTFAGGRFVIWAGSSSLEAELTIYGSGVPIIKSERGSLVLRNNFVE